MKIFVFLFTAVLSYLDKTKQAQQAHKQEIPFIYRMMEIKTETREQLFVIVKSKSLWNAMITSDRDTDKITSLH